MATSRRAKPRLLFLLVSLAALAGLSRAQQQPPTSVMSADEPEAFVRLDSGTMGLASGGVVMSLGDFNSDKYTDLAVLNVASGCIGFALWQHDDYAFALQPLSVCAPEGSRIDNVILTDMDYNGTLDVVLTTSSNKLCIVPGGKLVWASTEAVVCEPIVPVDQQADLVGQWTAISVNGQMRPDLFGAVADGAALITFNSTTGMYERKASPFQGACELAAEHSHAFIDINGDCFADMVLTCKPQFKDGAWTSSFEIWLASKPTAAAAPVFTKQLTVDVPSRIGPVSFVDIDADGDSDLVYVLCSDQTETTTCDVGNAIHAHLNNQDPLTDSSVLCPVDPTFSLSTAWFVVYDLSVASANSRFLIHTTHLAPGSTATVPIRWGDYNIDGFPDALVTLVDVEKGTTSVQLLANVACSSGCSAGAKRSLAVDAAATGAISNLENGLSAFFFDFDERGRLSVIAMQTAGELIVPFFNNIHADAFFMKTLILNGVCYGTSTCGIAVNPVGVNEPGVTVKFVVTDTQGVRRLVQGSQLPQFCYGSLNAPYVFYGLGRTNSYIDDFSVGLLVQSDSPVHVWNGIIPNSQLVISPSASDTDWQMELYILPSVYSVWVALTLFVTAVLLFIVVGALHWIEMQQDARERRGALMFVNFDVFS